MPRSKTPAEKIDRRLLAAASFVRRGAVFADIGTDHAYLPVFLVSSGIVERAFAADINRGPLDRADENIALSGLAGQIETRLTDGLCGLEGLSITDIAICGMGGDLMADILDRAPWAKKASLVVQPMSKQERLRRYLRDNGYTIAEERLVYEEHRLYTLMRIEEGAYEGGDHLLWSKAMESDPLFSDYIRALRSRFQRQFDGSGSEEDRRMLELLKEREACL